MNENKNADWLKFIITGSVSDYLNYRNADMNGGSVDNGGKNSLYDRRTCDKRTERGGE